LVSTQPIPTPHEKEHNPNPDQLNPTLDSSKNLNKLVEIAKGGRVSNPVPSNAGPKAGRALVVAELRRTWSAEALLVADMPEFSLELPLNAM